MRTTTNSKPVHKLDDNFGARNLEGAINVILIGCGGNGAQMLTKLARLHVTLRAIGHTAGFKVYVCDPDEVAPSNIGRQMYSPADLGLNKAVVSVNRINAFYGLNWVAYPHVYGEDGIWQNGFMGESSNYRIRSSVPAHLVVSCVDSAKSRRHIEKSFNKGWNNRPHYWLDLGNSRDTGQVVLGQPRRLGLSNAKGHCTAAEAEAENRLPTVMEMFPELRNARIKEDNEPSCSLADALDSQSLFVNDNITSWAAQLLDDLFRGGKIEYHGAFINLKTGIVNPIPVPAPVKVEKSETATKPVRRNTRMATRRAA